MFQLLNQTAIFVETFEQKRIYLFITYTVHALNVKMNITQYLELQFGLSM